MALQTHLVTLRLRTNGLNYLQVRQLQQLQQYNATYCAK